jgi:ABC-type uncharacterized transport system involved in gliding motility auxiliary subunit
MQHTKLLTTSGLVMALALFFAVNIASNTVLKSAQLDLTENKLYTLSEGSKNILKNLKETITLRFYLSQKLLTSLPGVNNYAVRVGELLEEYQRLAGDKLKLMVIDPEPFSEEEDRAEGFGLQGVPVNESNTSFYFGLAGTNSTDDHEIIAFFNPNREEFLEYDVTQLVSRLATPKQTVIGIMSTLPIQGQMGSPMMPPEASQQPWMIVEHLRQSFEVRNVDTKVEEIPKEIKVLMIVHPKNLGDNTLYAIDQFVLHGGRVMAFVDPYSEADQPPRDPNNPMAAMQAPRHSELTKLFDAWGIELVAKKAVGDLKVAQRVQVRKGSRVMPINYPVWMDLNTSDYFNKQDIVTGKLGNIAVASAGALVKKGSVGTQIIPLMESSDQAMLIDTDKLGFMLDPEELVRNFKPEGKKFTMAVRITGKVKTAFPEGKPKKEEKEKKDAEKEKEKKETESKPLTESVEPVNLIVVADTDLLADQFWVRVQNFLGQRIALPHAANATFVSNALDNLSGSNDLISVRNRGSSSRPFTRVQAIQQEAEQSFRAKEKELLARLQETDQKIRSLQTQKQEGNAVALSAEQQQEITRFRDEKIKTRKELRNVQHELQKNIEGLEGGMKFINIGFMPLLIGIGGIIISIYRHRRKRGLQPVKG